VLIGCASVVVAGNVSASSTTQTSRIMFQAKWANKLLVPPLKSHYARCVRQHFSKQKGQHPLTGQRAPPISGGT